MVEDAPGIDELNPAICRLLFGAKAIAGYNIIGFDMPFLAHFMPTPCDMDQGIDMPVVDVMLDFAPIAGEWSDEHGGWKWQTLAKCARYFDIGFRPHDAHEDVEATRQCLYKIGRLQSDKFRSA